MELFKLEEVVVMINEFVELRVKSLVVSCRQDDLDVARKTDRKPVEVKGVVELVELVDGVEDDDDLALGWQVVQEVLELLFQFEEGARHGHVTVHVDLLHDAANHLVDVRTVWSRSNETSADEERLRVGHPNRNLPKCNNWGNIP